MKTANIKKGSALIMTIVLTVLLAIIGILFVLMARMEKTATSARSESEELKLASDSIVATISQRLADDVPKNNDIGRFYDYPGRWDIAGFPYPLDSNDSWLANLEPEDNGGYQWRHISDVYNTMGYDAYKVSLNVSQAICEDYQKIIDTNSANNNSLADADGDGVADARWVAVPDLTTSKGKSVYAAVRIVDNGGMLNVNTAYTFDPCQPGVNGVDIDGSSQMQINVAALAGRGANGTSDTAAGKLQYWRCNYGSEPNNLSLYQQNVVWPMNQIGAYTPFDISDELKLRNRYLINYNLITTRIEKLWTKAYENRPWQPIPTPTYNTIGDWFNFATINPLDPNNMDNYDYRHISTTHNMDRTIAPDGQPMVWINNPNINLNDVYTRMLESYDSNSVNIPAAVKDEYAQVAVNIKDYRDSDSNITTFTPDPNGATYYGLERPIIYIAELARNFVTEPGPPLLVHRSYGIVIYKQPGSETFSDWQLTIQGQADIILDNSSFGASGFYVHIFDDPVADLKADVNSAARSVIVPNPSSEPILDFGFRIQLTRPVGADRVIVDVVEVPPWFTDLTDGELRFKRDMAQQRWVKRLWDVAGTLRDNYTPLGDYNRFGSGDSNAIQTWVANANFRNVGDLGYMLTKAVYHKPGDNMAKVIGYPVGSNITTDTEAKVRIDLADPNVQKLFQYLTVLNPGEHIGNAAGETRVQGRININTAPWYVIKQLPWVGLRNGYDADSLAKAIAAYRDRDKVVDANVTMVDYTLSRRNSTGLLSELREIPGFASIGELATVINNAGKNDYSMWYYSLGGKIGNDIDYPDLTTDATGSSDLVAGDFEKRNLIFARISDLVTVRSDVFTAYILIRLGDNGPQRRVMAIFDRSGYPSEPVKVIALQVVPEAR